MAKEKGTGKPAGTRSTVLYVLQVLSAAAVEGP